MIPDELYIVLSLLWIVILAHLVTARRRKRK